MKRFKQSTLSSVAALAALGMLAFAGAAPTAEAETRFTVKLGVSTPPGHVYNVALDAFKEMVERESNGEIVVNIFPSAQLGGEVENARDVQLGTLEMALPATSNLAGFQPKYNAFSVPYLMNSLDCALVVANGPALGSIGEELRETHGIRVLTHFTFGERQFYNTERPILTPADLEGLKMRAPDRMMEMMYSTFGAQPTPLPFPEVFTALQQGVIDGEANPLVSMRLFRWYEVAKFVSLTDVIIGLAPLIINERYFQKMTKADQDLLMRAAKHGASVNFNAQNKLTEEALTYLKGKGVRFDEPDKEPFRKALQPMFDFARKEYGADFIQSLISAQSGC